MELPLSHFVILRRLKTASGRAAISAANTKHGHYKNWPKKQAKERYYRGEIKRVMREAELAGLLVGK